MSLFGKVKKEELSQGQEQLAGRMAGIICFWQRRLSDTLNSMTAGFGTGTWVLLLVVGYAGFGSYCAYLIWTAFN